MNILPNKSMGGGKNKCEGKLFPQNVQILILFTLFFQFLPLNLQIFCNFSPKIAHFYNFFPKECNFEKFSTSVSKKYGESFSQFFHNCGKSQFFCRIFTYDTGREVSLEFSLV